MTGADKLLGGKMMDAIKYGDKTYIAEPYVRQAVNAALATNEQRNARIAQLEGVVKTLGAALKEGYHSGFCNGPCPTCDRYQAAMVLADEFAQGDL